MDDQKMLPESEQEKHRRSFKQVLEEIGVLTPFNITVACLFVISLLIYLISRFSTAFAEFIARYPSQAIRFLLGKITSVFKFSLAETLFILIPVIFTAYVIYAFRRIKRNEEKFVAKCIMPLVSFLLILLTIFFSAFGPCYFRNDIAENLSLERKAVSVDDLYETAKWLCDEINTIVYDIHYNYEGASYMPYSYNELVEKMNTAYSSFSAGHDFINTFDSYPKPIALSEPLSYTKITGVYSFFTGEANINTNYPDFLTPFTVAHEMAHQRGIAREDEANFMAFMICLESKDTYVRYSGMVNVYRYLANALASESEELYSDLIRNYRPKHLSMELSAYSKFFEKYKDSTVSKVTDATNDMFLQSQGQSEGIKSYNLVVDLAVAYHSKINNY